MRKINKYRVIQTKTDNGYRGHYDRISSNDLNEVYQWLSKKMARIARTGRCGDRYCLRQGCKSEYEIKEMH